jgi:transitional endoplasmic reticulum ATPase
MFPLALLHYPAVEADTDGRTKNESTLVLFCCIMPDLMGQPPTRVSLNKTTSHSPADCTAAASANSVDVCYLASAMTLHTFVTRPQKFDSSTKEVVVEAGTAATPIDTLLAISCLIPTVYPVMVPQTRAATENKGTSATKTTTRAILSPVQRTVRIHCNDPRTTPIDPTSIERWWGWVERVPLPAQSIVASVFPILHKNHRDKQDDSIWPPSALLLACLKRQLVGCPILYTVETDASRTITTTTRISIPGVDTTAAVGALSWTVTVESMTLNTTYTHRTPPPPRTNRSATDTILVGLIVPSTRITLVPPAAAAATFTQSSNNTESGGSEQSTKPPLDPSGLLERASVAAAPCPATRTLSDSIVCLRRIMNRRGCDPPGHVDQVGGHGQYPLCDISRTMDLSGPPGVGKTHAVRTVVQQEHCRLVLVSGSEILGDCPLPAQAAQTLTGLWTNAATQSQAQDSITVIFLDECDALMGSSSDQGSLSSCVIVATLCRLLDEMHTNQLWKRLLVVAATNRIDTLPACLRRPGRLDREIPMAPPNAAARLELLTTLLASANTTSDSKNSAETILSTTATTSSNSGNDYAPISTTELEEIAHLTVGYVAADLVALVRRAWFLSALHPETTMSESLRRAMEHVGASALRDATLQQPSVAAAAAPSSGSTSSSPSTPWDEIAGDPGGAKTALRQAIEWPRTKYLACQQLGLTPPRGILLHGPPGCAKTTLARAAAASAGVAFLSLAPADVFASSYVGDAEAVVRRAFTLARATSPCVLFFDELDAILGCDENNSDHSNGMGRASSSSAEARVLSTFLNEMDGVDGSWKDGVLVLGATNRPGTLDAALLRPGRFDKIIYVPPPDYQGRRSILSMQCKKWPCRINVDQLAEESVTGMMTGAEIVGACREAVMRWLREVPPSTGTMTTVPDSAGETGSILEANLVQALGAVKPLLSNPDVLAEYTAFEERRRRR